jgi:hypothetical protein
VLESIVDQLPALAEHERKTTDLEREIAETQSRIYALNSRILEQKETDLNNAAKALNAGRKAPAAKAPALEHQAQESAEALLLLQRRHELASSERSRFVQDHRAEIVSLLTNVHRDAAQQVSKRAEDTLALLLKLYAIEDEERQLARHYPEPQPEPDPTQEITPQPITTIWPLQTTANIAAPGRRRGEIEETLRYLVGMGAETEVGPTPEESGAA